MQRASAPIKISLPFANSAGASYRRQVPNPSQIATLPGAASYTDGFPPATFTPVASGGIPPFGSDMNGVLFQMTSWDRWHQAGGPVRYDNVFQAAIGGYPQEARVGSNATPYLVWQSTIDNNTTNPDIAAARVGWQTPVFPNPSGLLAGLTVTGSPLPDLGAGIAFDGGGAIAPKKWIRVLTGQMEWMNNAYNLAIMTLTDAGHLTAVGQIAGNSIVGATGSFTGLITGGSIKLTGSMEAASAIIFGPLTVHGSIIGNVDATLAGKVKATTVESTAGMKAATTMEVGTNLTVQGTASVTGTLTAGSVSAASATLTGAVTANSITTKTLVANNTTPGVWAINGNQIYGAALQAGSSFVFNNYFSGEWQAYVYGGHHVIRHRGSTGGDWQEFWNGSNGDWHWQVGGLDLMHLSGIGSLDVRREIQLGNSETNSLIRFRNGAGATEGYLTRDNTGNQIVLTPGGGGGLCVYPGGSILASGGRVRASIGSLDPGSDGNTCPVRGDFTITTVQTGVPGGVVGVQGSWLFRTPQWWLQAIYCTLNNTTAYRANTDLGFPYAFPSACAGAVVQYNGGLPGHASSNPGLSIQLMDRTWFRAWVGQTNYDMGGGLGVVVLAWGY